MKMKIKYLLLYLVIAGASVLSACGGGSTTGSSAASTNQGDTASQAAAKIDNTCGLPNFQVEMLATINAKRAAGAVCGTDVMPSTHALNWNSQLQNAATVHALDMASTSNYSHTGSDGSTPANRIAAAGYASGYFGENIDAQRNTIQSVMESWMNSPAHCKNIMQAGYQDVGVSCINNPSSQWGTYWSMELGARS